MGEITERKPLATDPREGNLPRWARDLLNEARRRVADAEALADAARLATHPDKSDAILRPHHDGEQIGLGVGRRATVGFRVPFRGHPDGLMVVSPAKVSGDPDELGIRIQGSSSLVIEPQVTNVVVIRPGKW